MLFHAISAYSSVSEAAAVSQATAVASSDYGRDAKSVHIIVDAVFKVGDGWKAVVRVLVELDLDIEEEIREKHEEHFAKIDKKKLLDEDDLIEEFSEGPIVYAHFPERYQEIYDEFSALELDVKSHILEEGPLWDLIQDYYLDVEFYEATHSLELQRKHKDDTRKLNNNLKSPWVRQKIHAYIQNLELV